MLMVLCYLLPCSSVLGQSGSAHIEDICMVPGYSKKFVDYQKTVSERCQRNRECYFPLQKRVTVKFFVMENGVVRDPQIVNSSGIDSHDMSCIDAVLCTSPLPPPPYRYLPPPPDNDLAVDQSIWVDSFPAGPITVSFNAREDKSPFRLKEWNETNSLYLPLIPIEAAHRYPAAFNKSELLENKNYRRLAIAPNTQNPIKFRYPWTAYYQAHKSASRKSILLRLSAVQKYNSLFSESGNWREPFEK